MSRDPTNSWFKTISDSIDLSKFSFVHLNVNSINSSEKRPGSSKARQPKALVSALLC